LGKTLLYKALKYTRKCIALNKSSTEGWNNMGFYLQHFGKVDFAIICYNKALHIDNKFVNSLMNKALAYLDKNRNDTAMVNLNKVLK